MQNAGQTEMDFQETNFVTFGVPIASAVHISQPHRSDQNEPMVLCELRPSRFNNEINEQFGVPQFCSAAASTPSCLTTSVPESVPSLELIDSISTTENSNSGSFSSRIQSEIKIPPVDAPGSKLAALLGQETNGRIIIKSYLHHNSFLSATARKYLVNFIIDTELKKALTTLSPYGRDMLKEFKISTEKLKEYSLEIAGLFPSENSLGYFSPFQVTNGVRKDPCGKLWEHYNYVKGLLRDQGVLARKSHKSNDTEKLTPNLNENDAEKLKLLQHKSTPLDEVLTLWKETFAARREILAKGQTIYEYYRSIIGLRMQEGIHLIDCDFNRLYPGQSRAFHSKWDLIAEHLMMTIRTSKAIKNVEDKALALLLPKLSKDQQTSVIFYLLAAIAPQDRAVKKRKTSASDKSGTPIPKTSLHERRDSFTLRVPIASEVQSEVSRVKADLHRNGQTFQPTPVVVGTVTEIHACYVAVNDTLYETKSYIDAIDLTFKIFFATNCKYPERSKILWQLIQKGIFGIDDDCEKLITWVKFLAQELQTVIARQPLH